MSVLVVCMSCLCLWLGKLSVLVSADYVLQVEVVFYNHGFNTRFDGQCCDPRNGGGCTGGERCDTYFTYCLRPRFTEAATIECPNTEPGFTANSTNVVDGATIDFTQPTVLGLPNPFNLTGISTAWEGAQLYIQVFDLDDDGADVIERFRFDASFINGTILPVGTTAGGTINGNRAAITASVTVLCAPFYTGSSCEILNHCESNAVTCSERGTCVNGFDGSSCDCNPPYIGENCESQDFCFNTNCNERGTCNNGLNSYTCSCDPGYTGTDCEDDIDDCLNVNCSGNGVCVDGVNSFSCECMSGFTGERCSVETQEMRSDDATPAIAGGVVGGLVVIVLIAVLIVVIVILIVKNKQESSRYISGGTTNNDIPCQNNVVYGVCEMAQPQPNTLATAPPPSSLQEHEFDYPLCDMSEPLPPVYKSVDEKLMLNVNVSYVTVAEREDGLEQTSGIYNDVNMRQ
ncbi:sushi, von Willebrand factor type A, EGF and pentraxin domain-containing protein 1-like isoform X2 [Halichondria panicea]|uniref:sushi, von Willebrand factor type A, EGF and pentraxin domain-containing protein 1-like isoform X2 n=1 Tax=Halichondria panicea TaxID=6063 RepID=UPI00312B7B4A